MRFFFFWIICVFVSCVSHAFSSVHCCLVVTCWERADLLALVGDADCICVTFPCAILYQVWYLTVDISFPDLCFFLTFIWKREVPKSCDCLSCCAMSVAESPASGMGWG